ncbi:hypothetical protein JHK87_000711 [Glycine soja]|nr:hypothetical protein JHK87_000711 [Glycine soja]
MQSQLPFMLHQFNGIRIVLELSYVLIYFWYASTKGKVKVAMTTIPFLLVFFIIVAMSAFPFHDNHHRKLLVGSIGLSVSITIIMESENGVAMEDEKHVIGETTKENINKEAENSCNAKIQTKNKGHGGKGGVASKNNKFAT